MTTVAEATVPQAPLSDRRLQIAIVVLCLLGIGDAGYLSYVHYAGIKVLCLSSGGCETVQASRWAKLDGVPVSVLGLIGYLGILGSLAIRTELGRGTAFAIALIGFGFSMYLTYRELFTIKAICQWCVGSAVLMTALAVITAARFLRDHEGAGAARE
ncbi:MAG: vitamin K epoxide reductase family protein [Solirubrobacteraceae bacterium]